jgi:hypothetical protein
MTISLKKAVFFSILFSNRVSLYTNTMKRKRNLGWASPANKKVSQTEGLTVKDILVSEPVLLHGEFHPKSGESTTAML